MKLTIMVMKMNESISQWHTNDFNLTPPVIYVSCNAPMCIHPSVDTEMTQSLVNFLYQCLNVPLVRQHHVMCRHGFYTGMNSNAIIKKW